MARGQARVEAMFTFAMAASASVRLLGLSASPAIRPRDTARCGGRCTNDGHRRCGTRSDASNRRRRQISTSAAACPILAAR